MNVTSVAPPQQRMTAQGLRCARRTMSAFHLARTHTLSLATHSQTYRIYPKWSICVLLLSSQHMGCLTPLALFQRAAAQLLFIDPEKCLCVRTMCWLNKKEQTFLKGWVHPNYKITCFFSNYLPSTIVVVSTVTSRWEGSWFECVWVPSRDSHNPETCT